MYNKTLVRSTPVSISSHCGEECDAGIARIWSPSNRNISEPLSRSLLYYRNAREPRCYVEISASDLDPKLAKRSRAKEIEGEWVVNLELGFGTAAAADKAQMKLVKIEYRYLDKGVWVIRFRCRQSPTWCSC